MSSKETIFICYRRSDTEGYAGRLADSLKAYFGSDRVFRDVSGIKGGDDYVVKIERTISDARVVVVIIGPHWLSKGEDNKPRLHDPGDHVAAEIAAALDKERKIIIPVLVQGARMPTDSDLPAQLKDLVRKHAVSIGDEHWGSDVTRLAKIIAMDVSGSVAERKLTRLQWVVLSSLAVPMVTALVVFATHLALSSALIAQPLPEKVWLASSSFGIVGIMLVVVALALMASHFHPTKRKVVRIAVVGGFLGCLGTVIYYQLSPDNMVRQYVALAATGLAITAMLVLLNLSAFKPNDDLS